MAEIHCPYNVIGSSVSESEKHTINSLKKGLAMEEKEKKKKKKSGGVVGFFRDFTYGMATHGMA
ncbi:MAG: hypothetical protein JSW56_13690, partial [Deltaproteobacteria bacterium]